MYNMLAKLNDNRGYDPYNHVGCHMQPVLKPLEDKIFVMSPKMLDLFQKDIISTYKPMMPVSHTYMGIKFISNPHIFTTPIS